MENTSSNTTVLDIINQNKHYQPKPKVRVKTIYPRSQILWAALMNNPFKYMSLSSSKLGSQFDLSKTQSWKVKATMVNYANAEVPPPPLWKSINPRYKPTDKTAQPATPLLPLKDNKTYQGNGAMISQGVG